MREGAFPLDNVFLVLYINAMDFREINFLIFNLIASSDGLAACLVFLCSQVVEFKKPFCKIMQSLIDQGLISHKLRVVQEQDVVAYLTKGKYSIRSAKVVCGVKSRKYKIQYFRHSTSVWFTYACRVVDAHDNVVFNPLEGVNTFDEDLLLKEMYIAPIGKNTRSAK